VKPLPRTLRLVGRTNWLMTAGLGLLLVIGVMFVYSACFISDEQPVRLLYKRQIAWAVVGFACYFACAIYDYRNFRRTAWWCYGAGLLLLVAVLLVGKVVYGARRWLMFFDFGIQPSEFAKLATVIVLAMIMSRPSPHLQGLKPVFVSLFVAGVPMGLVIVEPDLGTAMIFLPVALIMMFAAGMSVRWLGLVVALCAAVVMLMLGAIFLPEKMGASPATQERIANMLPLGQYQRNRIVAYFQPDKDPLGASWNKTQSEIAVGSGGVWGKGFLKGDQNVLGFLPRSVAPTDFIYSVIAEEKGFFGSVVVLLLFGFLITCGTLAALAARDKLGRLLCVGLMATIFCHVFINIAMTVGLMPITGLPLPFLSYGGSFMVVTMSALGIVQSVYVRSRPARHVFSSA
jgi:rod shape determining protein RodA